MGWDSCKPLYLNNYPKMAQPLPSKLLKLNDK